VHEIGSGPHRSDLGYLQRSEAARIGKLNLVGDPLVAEDQQRVFLEGGPEPCVERAILGDIGDRLIGSANTVLLVFGGLTVFGVIAVVWAMMKSGRSRS